MLSSFQLSVPADARYRVLAPEVAAKYAALAGCSESEAQAFLAEVEQAVVALSVPDGDVAMVFTTDGDTLLATLTAGAASTTVRRSLSAAK